MHAFNPSSQEVEAGGLCEFEASQDYTEKPVSKTEKKERVGLSN